MFVSRRRQISPCLASRVRRRFQHNTHDGYTRSCSRRRRKVEFGVSQINLSRRCSTHSRKAAHMRFLFSSIVPPSCTPCTLGPHKQGRSDPCSFTRPWSQQARGYISLTPASGHFPSPKCRAHQPHTAARLACSPRSSMWSAVAPPTCAAPIRASLPIDDRATWLRRPVESPVSTSGRTKQDVPRRRSSSQYRYAESQAMLGKPEACRLCTGTLLAFRAADGGVHDVSQASGTTLCVCKGRSFPVPGVWGNACYVHETCWV